MATTWITFYSYKGGVGRSLALTNVAASLAKKGRRVVMIDFDLEAPGLDSFSEFQSRRAPGVVEYVSDCLENRAAPPVRNYVHEFACPAEIKGSLWLMPSGRKDSQYALKLHSINWTQLYDRGIAQPLIANWKSAIEKTFNPDYVFIDSRTGLTDIGGVCTLHFPDIVVLMFALNRQNLDGIEGVFKTIINQKNRAPIQIITVASPVPNLDQESSVALKERMEEATRKLGGSINSTISYYAPAALIEKVWTLDSSGTPRNAFEYENLREKIESRVTDGIDFLISGATRAQESSDAQSAQKIIEALQSEYSDRSDAHVAIAKLQRLLGRHEEMVSSYKSALKIEPSLQEAFVPAVGYYRSNRDKNSVATLIGELCAKLKTNILPRHAYTWAQIGQEYMWVGDYHSALEAYKISMECNPKYRNSLPDLFNLCEAHRRTDEKLAPNLWVDVVNLHQGMPLLNSTAAQANYLQAIHIAYAMVGKITEAREWLSRAIVLASNLNTTAKVFSVDVYEEIPVSEFLSRSNLMLSALERGELWDGTKLRNFQLQG